VAKNSSMPCQLIAILLATGRDKELILTMEELFLGNMILHKIKTNPMRNLIKKLSPVINLKLQNRAEIHFIQVPGHTIFNKEAVNSKLVDLNQL